MDRTEGSNFIDIGGGRRGFQDQNAEAGVPGTRVTASYLNAIQEEIMAVIENAGLTADKANWQQLDAAIRKLAAKIVNDYNIPLAQLNCLPWLPIISLTQKTPPTKPAIGDMYVVPDNCNGEWSDKASQIAEWNGSKWLFSTAKDGHGIGLPDGSIYIKIGGKYVLPQNKTIGFSAAGSVSLNIPPSVNFLMQKYKIVEFDTEKSFNNATGSYVCPFSGYFTISGWFWFVDIEAITKVYLQKNNDLIAEQSTNAHGRVLSVTTTVNVQKGDQLRMLLVQESGTTMITYDQYRATCGFSGIFAGSVK